jgi:hypothetical protein
MVQERGNSVARWRGEADMPARIVPGLPSFACWWPLVFALAYVGMPASAAPAPLVPSPVGDPPAERDTVGEAMRSRDALDQQMRTQIAELKASTARANANMDALTQAAKAIPSPPAPDYSHAPTLLEFAAMGVVIAVLLLWLAMVGRGFRACVLYAHGRSCDARVLRRFRRFGAIAVLEYEFWSLEGRHTGMAPAHCAGGDTVHIVYNDAHPDWHRPRVLLFNDVLTAGTFFLAPLTLLLLRLGGVVWDVGMQRLRGVRAG